MRLEKRELVGFAKIGQNAKAIEFREIRGRKLGLAQDLLFGKEGFSLKLLARFDDALRRAFPKVVDDHEGRDEGHAQERPQNPDLRRVPIAQTP